MEKFDKNQYQILLKKFESLKQKDSVVEYQIAFEEIAQGLLLYNSGYDDTYFVKGAWKPRVEKTKTGEVDKGKHLNPRPEAEDKLSALKEFRKKNGL